MLRLVSTNVARQVFVGLLQLALVAILGHGFGPEGVGLYTLAMMLPSLGAQMLTFGLQSSTVYFLNHGPFGPGTLVRTHLWVSAWVGSAFLLLMLPAAFVWGGALLPKLSPGQRIIVVSGFVPCYVLLLLPAIAQGVQNFAVFNFALLFQPVLQLGLVVGQVLLGHDLQQVVLSYTLSSWLAAAVLVVLALRLWGLGEAQSLRFFRQSLRFGLFAHLGNVIVLLNYRAAIWLINGLSGLQSAGYFAMAMQPAEKLWLPSQAAATVQFPKLAKAFGAGDVALLERVTGRLARWILLLTALLAGVTAALAPWAMPLLFGAKAAGAVGLLWILLPGIVAWAPSRILAHDLLARGAADANLWNGVATFAISLLLMVPLTLLWGGRGAALAVSVAYCCDLLIRSVFYAKHSGTPFLAWLLAPGGDPGRVHLPVR